MPLETLSPSTELGDFLADILESARLLAPEDIERYQRVARDENTYVEDVLLREKAFTRKELLQVLENHFFCPAAEVMSAPYQPELLGLIPAKLAFHHLAFPFEANGDTIKVAFAKPDYARAVDAIAQMVGRRVIPHVAFRQEIMAAIEESYRRFEEDLGRQRALALASSEEAFRGTPTRARKASILHLVFEEEPATAIIDRIFKAAIQRNISDIHIQPAERKLLVRFRMDDVLYTVGEIPQSEGNAVISRMKILAGMDIAEHRLPQDGRHALREDDLLVDMRISCIPCQFGEKIVIRLLRKNMNLLQLDNLRMPREVREAYEDCLTMPQGMFLVTGPTGSGKTTTLYATLAALDRESINVLTLEDPIEYTLENLTQVQIRADIGMTFAEGLKAFLRQDPDVILVGEIRDLVTVEIACRAALTGHKVFSTLHTNDSCQAITRLMDMGVAPYLIAATLKGILAQRLIRLNCEHCRESYPPSPTELAFMGLPNIGHLMRGKGCAGCSGTGYRGRRAVYEYFRIDEHYHRLILDRASPSVISEAAQNRGMVVLSEYARREVLAGITTVEEAERAVGCGLRVREAG